MASLSRPMQADPGHKGRAAMPGGPRSLPRRPSLRYLTALKQLICGQAQQQSHALAQVRWVIARFRDAGEPGWIAPDDDELRLHFDDQFLSEVPAAELIAAITSVAADLREEPTVIGQAPLSAHIQIGGLEVFAAAEANPPHRLTGLQAPPTGRRITDPRVAAPPPARALGEVPAEMAGIANEAFAELGLAALVLAGGGSDTA